MENEDLQKVLKNYSSRIKSLKEFRSLIEKLFKLYAQTGLPRAEAYRIEHCITHPDLLELWSTILPELEHPQPGNRNLPEKVQRLLAFAYQDYKQGFKYRKSRNKHKGAYRGKKSKNVGRKPEFERPIIYYTPMYS